MSFNGSEVRPLRISKSGSESPEASLRAINRGVGAIGSKTSNMRSFWSDLEKTTNSPPSPSARSPQLNNREKFQNNMFLRMDGSPKNPQRSPDLRATHSPDLRPVGMSSASYDQIHRLYGNTSPESHHSPDFGASGAAVPRSALSPRAMRLRATVSEDGFSSDLGRKSSLSRQGSTSRLQGPRLQNEPGTPSKLKKVVTFNKSAQVIQYEAVSPDLSSSPSMESQMNYDENDHDDDDDEEVPLPVDNIPVVDRPLSAVRSHNPSDHEPSASYVPSPPRPPVGRPLPQIPVDNRSVSEEESEQESEQEHPSSEEWEQQSEDGLKHHREPVDNVDRQQMGTEHDDSRTVQTYPLPVEKHCKEMAEQPNEQSDDQLDDHSDEDSVINNSFSSQMDDTSHQTDRESNHSEESVVDQEQEEDGDEFDFGSPGLADAGPFAEPDAEPELDRSISIRESQRKLPTFHAAPAVAQVDRTTSQRRRNIDMSLKMNSKDIDIVKKEPEEFDFAFGNSGAPKESDLPRNLGEETAPSREPDFASEREPEPASTREAEYESDGQSEHGQDQESEERQEPEPESIPAELPVAHLQKDASFNNLTSLWARPEANKEDAPSREANESYATNGGDPEPETGASVVSPEISSNNSGPEEHDTASAAVRESPKPYIKQEPVEVLYDLDQMLSEQQVDSNEDHSEQTPLATENEQTVSEDAEPSKIVLPTPVLPEFDSSPFIPDLDKGSGASNSPNESPEMPDEGEQRNQTKAIATPVLPEFDNSPFVAQDVLGTDTQAEGDDNDTLNSAVLQRHRFEDDLTNTNRPTQETNGPIVPAGPTLLPPTSDSHIKSEPQDQDTSPVPSLERPGLSPSTVDSPIKQEPLDTTQPFTWPELNHKNAPSLDVTDISGGFASEFSNVLGMDFENNSPPLDSTPGVVDRQVKGETANETATTSKPAPTMRASSGSKLKARPSLTPGDVSRISRTRSISNESKEASEDRHIADEISRVPVPMIQLDSDSIADDDSLMADIEQEFDKVLQVQKRGYTLRENNSVVIAKERERRVSEGRRRISGPLKRVRSSAGGLPSRKEKPTEPVPSLPPELAADAAKPATQPPAPDLPPADRGRLFVRLVSVRGIDLPNINEKRAKFKLTLDNGIHCITTPYSSMESVNYLDQEFELTVGDDLEFILTLKAKYTKQQTTVNVPKRRPVVVPSRTEYKEPKRHGLSRFFGSPRKATPSSLAPTPSPAQPITYTTQVRKDPWESLVAQDGSFGRSYIVFSQYEKEIYGQCATFEIPCYNEWAKGANNTKRAPYTIGKIQLQMMFVPRGSIKEELPKSIKEAMDELEESRELEPIHHEGFLSQLGGDCKYWRRRYFKLDGSTLTAYSESSRKPRATINLAKAVRVIHEKSQLTKPVVVVGKNRRKSAFAEQEEAFMFVDEGFRIRFGNGEIIDFYAEGQEEKNDWIQTISATIGTSASRSPWVEKVLRFEQTP
uniref:ARAD1D38038p n=1 Tax=Blastobotrys adeninivorans TaxID=409370 RepID=A0A060TBX0_BLAAD